MANVSSSNGLEKRPKLRFPGFDEPWEHKELLHYLVENTDRNKQLKFGKENVLSVSGEYGIVNQIAFQGRSFAGESVADYHVVETDDIVYTKSPLKANPYGIIKVNNGVPGIVSTLYAVYHPLKTVVPRFVDFYFSNDLRLNKFLKPLVNIGAKHDMKVNNTFVLTGMVVFPPLREQQKIVDFLTILDRRIDVQRKKVKALKKYKRGAIKSIFTQRVSFHAETNRWESHKMSELITLQSGQDFAPTDYNEQGKGIPYMTGASCIVEGQTVVSRWTTVPRCLAYRGDTLLVCKGSGSGAVAFLSQDKVHIARQFMALRPHESMTKEFCFYLTLHLSEKMKQSATGLIEGIDRKTVLNQRVFLPPIVEQERIVKFLSAIEKALITQEGVQKSLVSIKKGLMQQLFI